MKREDVYKLIDGEREYQLQRHEIKMAEFPHRDQDHHVADWVLYIEYCVEEAKNRLYEFDNVNALNNVRKIAALAVACMEYHDTEPRK